jgi:hypothetical protein
MQRAVMHASDRLVDPFRPMHRLNLNLLANSRRAHRLTAVLSDLPRVDALSMYLDRNSLAQNSCVETFCLTFLNIVD